MLELRKKIPPTSRRKSLLAVFLKQIDSQILVQQNESIPELPRIAFQDMCSKGKPRTSSEKERRGTESSGYSDFSFVELWQPLLGLAINGQGGIFSSSC